MAHGKSRIERIGFVTVVALLLALTATWPAAADVTCTGSIGSQTIGDNVHVPDGASCTLNGTSVEGNVLVGQGATLTASGVTVDGNIQDDNNNAGHVQVSSSNVLGNIQLEQGTSASITTTVIDGDLQLESNSGPLSAEGNTIDGNLQANQNTGGLAIVGNTIEGNLQCQSNNPAPTGSGNVVHGDAEGQCADLTGGTSPPPPAGNGRDTGRISGSDRFATAVEISKIAYPQGAPIVYLARGDDFADALGAKSLTAGPVLLVRTCDLPAVVAAEIRRLDPDEVVALGGTAAVCDQVLQQAADA